MKKSWLSSGVALCLLMTGLQVSAQKENKFTVKQAADYATKNAVQVKNALLDIQIQAQTNREITASAYPQISGGFTFQDYFETPKNLFPDFAAFAYKALQEEGIKNGNTNQPISSQDGFKKFPSQLISFVQPYQATGSLDVSQLLFDGQVFVGLQARSAAMDLARKTTEVTQEQIKANVYKIYYQLVVGNKQMATIDANIERFEKLLHDTKEIFKNGFAEKLDVDKVQVQLNNLQTEKIKIQNQLDIGNAGLKFLMNMPQKETLILTDTLSEDELKNGILDEQYDYKNRKEFELLQVASKLGEYNVKRYKLSRIPTVAAFASYQKNAQRQKFDFFNKGDWYTTSLAGLKVSVPIFDGNARRARIEKAKLDLQKTNNNLEQLKESIDYDVNSARLRMKSALLTLDNQKQNIQLSEKVYRTTKLKYEQGLGSNSEIYNANADLKVAQNNYYSALYDAINAKIDYLKATGKL